MILILIAVCAILCALFEHDIWTAEVMIFLCALFMLLVEAMNIGERE